MVKEEILAKLRVAEEDTAKRVAAAKDRANDILKGARREAEERITNAQGEARMAEDMALAEERKRLEKERDKILASGAQDEQTLRASYRKKVAQHVTKGLESFERSA